MKSEIEKGFDGYNFPAKQVMAISTLLLADKLATDFIFKDGRELTVEDVVDIPTRKKMYQKVRDAMNSFLKVFPCTGNTLMHNSAVINGDSRKLQMSMETYMYTFIRNLLKIS